MHKYIFVVQTNSPLARMIKLVGKMEKIINDWGYEVKFISVEEVEGENGQGTNKAND